VAVTVVVVIRFERFCFTDLAQTDDVDLRYLSRSGWIVVIVCSIPIGGILYLYSGKTR
jgi:hypothetical protein